MYRLLPPGPPTLLLVRPMLILIFYSERIEGRVALQRVWHRVPNMAASVARRFISYDNQRIGSQKTNKLQALSLRSTTLHCVLTEAAVNSLCPYLFVCRHTAPPSTTPIVRLSRPVSRPVKSRSYIPVCTVVEQRAFIAAELVYECRRCSRLCRTTPSPLAGDLVEGLGDRVGALVPNFFAVPSKMLNSGGGRQGIIYPSHRGVFTP